MDRPIPCPVNGDRSQWGLSSADEVLGAKLYRSTAGVCAGLRGCSAAGEVLTSPVLLCAPAWVGPPVLGRNVNAADGCSTAWLLLDTAACAAVCSALNPVGLDRPDVLTAACWPCSNPAGGHVGDAACNVCRAAEPSPAAALSWRMTGLMMLLAADEEEEAVAAGSALGLYTAHAFGLKDDRGLSPSGLALLLPGDWGCSG